MLWKVCNKLKKLPNYNSVSNEPMFFVLYIGSWKHDFQAFHSSKKSKLDL